MQKKSSGSFKDIINKIRFQNQIFNKYVWRGLRIKQPTMVDMPQNQTKPNPIYLIYVYKEDLALNNLQWLICHKTQPNQILYI